MPLIKPLFSGPGLDRADALRGDPETIAALTRKPGARELAWADGLPLVGSDGDPQWGPVTRPELFLGLEAGEPRFSAIPDKVEGFRAAWPLLDRLAANRAPLFAAALSLAAWHVAHPFCSKCGSETRSIRGGWSRQCSSCSAEHFPRTDPVVIMLAHNKENVVLGRQPQFPAGRYTALAGFVEVGESIEQAVAREFFEEVGIDVTNIRYVTSQPWPFPSSLMIACIAETSSAVLKIDRSELEDASWFTKDQVVSALSGDPKALFQAPPPFAVARTLLESWARNS